MKVLVAGVSGALGTPLTRALIAGGHHLARGSLVKKEEQLRAALAGKLSAHHRMQLAELLQLIATLDRSMARFDRGVSERFRRFDALLERLDAITGLSRRNSEVLLGEPGWDMSHFPDAAHAASWVGICPGQHETGGKQQSGRTRQGNSFRQNGAHPGGARGWSYAHLSGGTVSSVKSRGEGAKEPLWQAVTAFW